MWEKAERILKVAEKERRIKAELEKARQRNAFFEALCAFGYYGAESDIISSRPEKCRRDAVKDEELLFDLASLTKIIYSTALLLAMSERRIHFDRKVKEFLPEFTNEKISIKDVMVYRIWANDKTAFEDLKSLLFHPFSAAKSSYIRQLIIKMRAEKLEGDYSKYSNYPAWIMRFLLEAIANKNPERYIEQSLFQKAKMKDAHFAPLENSELSRLAPPEIRIEYPSRIAGMINKKVKTKRRADLPQDETAHNALLKGYGHLGHAGVFATIKDMQNFAKFLLYELRPRKRFWQRNFLFSDEIRRALWNYANYNDASKLGKDNFNLGFRYIGDNDRIFGRQISRAIFGHAGFSGTLFAVDPLSDSYLVFLANRCFPSRYLHRFCHAQNSSQDFNALRRKIAEIAFAS